jgi:hypothetical protein
MTQRFTRDESGMAMALAVMMILLIGVMGAGLLTFMQNDLKSIMEANKGQMSLDIADAGVEAAKSHLRQDSFREHYDTNRANDCAEGWRVGNENWSKATEGYFSAATPGKCDDPADEVTHPADDPATPWPDHYGVTDQFASGRFHVTIECYNQVDDGDVEGVTGFDPCDGGAAGLAPDTQPSTERKFFKITSTGYDTEAGDGAVRKIEAIYFTSQNTYVPLAYWTPGNINYNGTQCVKRMSFFAGGNITNVKRGLGCNGAASSPAGIIADRSQDALYRDWVKAPNNSTQRVDAGGNPVNSAGFGAGGFVCAGSPGPSCDGPEDSYADGYRDYDQTTGTKGQLKEFEIHAPYPTPAGQITFPFEEGTAIEDPSTLIDPGLLEEMEAAASAQNTYYPASGDYTIDTWPAEPGQDARYFIDGRGGPGVDVRFNVNTCVGSCAGDPKARGIIIVANGEFRFSNSSNGFDGVIIVIGEGGPDGGGTDDNSGSYQQTGSDQLDGYASASGNITIGGDVDPDTSVDLENLNSFTSLNFWSWRELYQ